MKCNANGLGSGSCAGSGMWIAAVIFRALVLCSVFMALTCDFSLAESYAEFDFSADLKSYAGKVAELNRKTAVVSDADKQHVRTRGSGSQLWTVLCKTDGESLEVVEEGLQFVVKGPRHRYSLYYSSLNGAEAAIEQYLARDCVVYAELDGEVTASSALQYANSTKFHSWGAVQMNYDAYLDFTFAWGEGSTTIAVIDSGVCSHELINGKMLRSGYDYIDADEDSTNDLYGHGTHVAGIIADCTAEAPVYIYPIRVLNGSGSGKISNIVNAIMEAVDQEVDIINLSIESHVMSDALDDAILEALSENIVVVVSAGNSSCNTQDVCPAHLANHGVIVVGSAEYDGGGCVRASYSNYGSSIDSYAFGSDISSCSRSGGYVENSGTSMAAPHISALCAMVRLIHPGLSPSAIEQRITSADGITGEVFVPDLRSMIPVTEGFSIQTLRMRETETILLPVMANPISSRESISYSSSDTEVVSIMAGGLKAEKAGHATVTVRCKGFGECTFEVLVEGNDNSLEYCLPLSLTVLEDEAFWGNELVERVTIHNKVTAIGDNVFENCACLRFISIPETVTYIGENSFSNAIVLCQYQSTIYDYCQGNGCQYIVVQ